MVNLTIRTNKVIEPFAITKDGQGIVYEIKVWIICGTAVTSPLAVQRFQFSVGSFLIAVPLPLSSIYVLAAECLHQLPIAYSINI